MIGAGALSFRDVMPRASDPWTARSQRSTLSETDVAPGMRQSDLVSHPMRDKVKGHVEMLLGLPGDWDSYGASPIQRGIVQTTERLLLQLIEHGLESPAVVPTSLGGVAFEWHRPNREFSVELRPAAAGTDITIFFADDLAHDEWESRLEDLDGDLLNEAYLRTVAG